MAKLAVYFYLFKAIIYVNYYNMCNTFLDPAEIIQKRNNAEENSVEYYVHYSGCE